MQLIGYIYEFEVDGVRYVGKCEHTAWTKRVAAHIRLLEKDAHHNLLLQKAWAGPTSFVYRILEVAPLEALDEREIYWTEKRQGVNDLPMRTIRKRLQQTIAREYARGNISMRALAEKHGVSQASVCNYVRRYGG